MQYNSSILQVGKHFFLQKGLVNYYDDTEDTLCDRHLPTLKGFVLHMIFNKLQAKDDWLEVIKPILFQQPIFFRPILKHALFYFNINGQKISDKE